MSVVLHLAGRLLFQRKRRFLITVSATIAATCLVLWIVSGYEAVLKSHDVFAGVAMGRYTLSVDAISRAADRQVLPEIGTALKEAPEVSVVDSFWARNLVVQSTEVVQDAPPPGSASASTEGVKEVLMLATNAEAPPFPLVQGEWLTEAETGADLKVVLTQKMATRFGMALGDWLQVGRSGFTMHLKVVGLVENPPVPITGRYGGNMQFPTPALGGLYLTMADAEKVTGQKPTLTFLGLITKPDIDINAFRFGWAPRLSKYAEPAQFQRDHDLEEQLDEAAVAKNMKMQAYAGTALTMLLAFLIIFNTLNMGVSEQIRQLAMLRAIGLTRLQVVAIIYLQGVGIALAGFVGGLTVGGLIIASSAKHAGQILRHGAEIGPLSFSLALLVTFGSAILAAVIPAWRSTRVKPLDAMNPIQIQTSRNYQLRWAVGIGLLLIAVVPMGTLFLASEQMAVAYLFGGTIALSMGFLLLAAPVAVMVEKYLGPWVARLLGIDPILLAEQLSTQLWRTVASVLALSVGLALFISIQVWGYTLLENFVPGPWAPDMMSQVGYKGVKKEWVQQLKDHPKIYGDQIQPVVLEQPRLRQDLTGSAERATVTRQDNVVLVGIDFKSAWQCEFPMLNFTFVAGSAREVLAKLDQNACIVPEHFLQETGLKVGDSFEVVPPENPQKPVKYTIAGAVRMQGWHWVTKAGGLRVRAHRAAALVFADLNQVCSDFDIPQPTHLWTNLTEALNDQVMIDLISQILGEISGKEVLTEKPKLDATEVVRNNQMVKDQLFLDSVTMDDVRESIRGMAAKWLWAVSVLPLVAMCVGALGVFNVIISSVESRRWELGVMRAIGFTRWTLIRVITAEGLLIGLSASLISLGFGITAGYLGAALSTYISFFGGMETGLKLPVWPLFCGVISAIIIATVAALIPALRIGFTKPI